MQGHLESVKEELHQTREDLQQSKETLVEKEDGFRKKLLESDAEIESSKKTIAELQVSRWAWVVDLAYVVDSWAWVVDELE